MITSVTEIQKGITYIFQRRELESPYLQGMERRVIEVGKDWVKTGVWRIA